ncbi:MAG: hypothetical protein C0404_00660 [Verrucomicrobia bacterium]|nr:hypothetical protein [Verrucomicrobiota bacterium]
MVTNGILAANEAAQTFDLGNTAGKYVRLVITNGYSAMWWELNEFQVFGTLISDTTAPVSGTATSPAATNASPIVVSYAGASDAGGSLLARVELWYKKGAGGTWFDSGLSRAGAAGSFVFTGMTGNDTYYFGLVAVDGSGNRSPAVSGAGDCSTAYAAPFVPINLILPANGGVLSSFTSQYSSTYGAAKLTDGVLGASSYWLSSATPVVPQGFVYSFSNSGVAVMSQAVIYNYGQGTFNRYSKGFHIDVSSDGVNYTVITNGVLTTNQTAQAFDLGSTAGRYVRLVITNGYSATWWELTEFQVFGVLSGPAPLSISGGASKVPSTTSGAAGVEESWPQVWSRGDWSPRFAAGNVIDGNTNTAWVGKLDGAPWLVSLDFGARTNLEDLQVMFWDNAWANTFVGGSVNGTNDWFDVQSSTNRPMGMRYLMIEMWNDPSKTAPPAIREIIWK